METIWGINVEARSVVYDYRMIFYIRGKKKKKLYPSDFLRGLRSFKSSYLQEFYWWLTFCHWKTFQENRPWSETEETPVGVGVAIKKEKNK